MKKECSQEFKNYIVEREFLNQKPVKHIIKEVVLSNFSTKEMLTNNTEKPYNYDSM